MKHSQKGVLCLVLALIGGLLSPARIYAAGDTTPYNWYCKNNSTHTPPVLDSEQRWIEDYDAYYLDRSINKNDKVIYLTFDAGYENGNVEKILDELHKHNAPGAFFILDNLITRAPELVKRMQAEGHLVCNHTKRHPDMTKISDRKAFAEQLTTLAEHYKELTGCEMPKIYRPPEGRYSKQNLEYAKSMGYKTVFWSFAYADWDNNRQMSEEAALQKILSHTHNGEIMLLHPTSATNAAIMDRLLTALEEEGYRFGKLTELWD
ncbi:MAG: polysaccharide deacetylase family protein [Clostridia bacterium]|nr:polysaccharide deacetylase family protein [Clostridia bacterium]